jgi:seryl-tRNA synthetase
MCSETAALTSGLSWKRTGFIGLSKSLRLLSEKIDRRFLDLAFAFDAEQQEFGPLLSVSDLRKIDYFSAFPHLVTFPASAAADDANLREFVLRNGALADGPLVTTRNAPVETVLAPAACYAVYIAMESCDIGVGSRTVTVRGTCFRSETRFEPLIRQPSFSMREIVHLGGARTVKSFLEQARGLVLTIAEEWGLAPSIEVAADPFFDPARSPKYVHATLFPSKHELIDHDVALSSFNNHRNFFGEAYRVSSKGEPVHTACVAFGIERWIAAILREHGSDPRDWPAELRPSKEDRQ